MKQQISALMDGELFEDEAGVLFDQFKQDPASNKDWAVYHLIGDVLRQPEHIHSDLSAGVRERMLDEPVVLAPRSRAVKQKMRAYALSAAASLAAIGVVVWMSVQITPAGSTQMAMRQSATLPVSTQMRPKADDYLMAHQEFVPSSDIMNGSASHIRTVSYTRNEK